MNVESRFSAPDHVPEGHVAHSSGARATIGRSRTKTLVALAIMIAMTGTALWANWARQRRIDAIKGLRVREECLDFGTVWYRDTLPWSVHVDNTSDRSIEIADMRLTCGCASISPKSATLPAGESVEFLLTLDLRPTSEAESRMPERKFVVQAFPVIPGLSRDQLCWTIQGSVRRAFETSLAELDFGDSLTVGFPFPERSFWVRCVVPDSTLVVDCDASLASVQAVPLNDGLHEYEVRVRPRTGLPVGKHAFPVLLRAAARADPAAISDKTPEMQMAVLARVYAEVRAMPEELLLGGGNVGDLLEEVVTLISPRKTFEVKKIECEPSSVSVEPLDAAGGAASKRRFRVCRTIDAPGIRFGEVRFFVSDAASGALQQVRVPVACEGFAREE